MPTAGAKKRETISYSAFLLSARAVTIMPRYESVFQYESN